MHRRRTGVSATSAQQRGSKPVVGLVARFNQARIQPQTQRKAAAQYKKGLPIWKALLKVVRLAGFEPTTPWFVAKYSIHLSYSRT
jgi:hypothetical protein